ncbi:MAG: FKBP-type peptidyl-prolyl cis-trans isomerase [Paramuribaculum sp.]|nr:FKBP-type peptidyl-prolyl cis-trans isomerase [Paramuribaculum sp.]
MKKIIVALGVAAVALGFSSCNSEGSSAAGNGSQSDSLAILDGDVQGASYLKMWNQLPDTLKAKLSKDKFIEGFKTVMSRDLKEDQSYMMGLNTAMQLVGNIAQMQEAGVKFDKDIYVSHFVEAFKKDSVDQAALMADNEQLRIYMNEVNEMIMKKQMADRQAAMEARKAEAEPEIKAGKEYVEAQKKADPSIQTTKSGVSYKVVKEGTGAKPGSTDNVKVNYTGKHIDGTEFDSSKGKPAEFAVNRVVPGFAEVLKMMAPGAKYVAYIPYDKAYGLDGTQNIKPGETLVFEIELVSVTPSAK